MTGTRSISAFGVMTRTERLLIRSTSKSGSSASATSCSTSSGESDDDVVRHQDDVDVRALVSVLGPLGPDCRVARVAAGEKSRSASPKSATASAVSSSQTSKMGFEEKLRQDVRLPVRPIDRAAAKDFGAVPDVLSQVLGQGAWSVATSRAASKDHLRPEIADEFGEPGVRAARVGGQCRFGRPRV